MLKPTVSVGECSIHVEDRGTLLMTIPHRMWESNLNEVGEVRWSGESRGESTTLSLVRYLQEKIQGCDDRSDLVTRLGEILKELRSPVWGKTFKEEEIEKRKRREGMSATVATSLGRETKGIEETREEFEWSGEALHRSARGALRARRRSTRREPPPHGRSMGKASNDVLRRRARNPMGTERFSPRALSLLSRGSTSTPSSLRARDEKSHAVAPLWTCAELP